MPRVTRDEHLEAHVASAYQQFPDESSIAIVLLAFDHNRAADRLFGQKQLRFLEEWLAILGGVDTGQFYRVLTLLLILDRDGVAIGNGNDLSNECCGLGEGTNQRQQRGCDDEKQSTDLQ